MPQFEKTLLVAPPPPPPPPPPPAPVHVIQPPKAFFTAGNLFAPKFIPKQIAQVKEEAPPPEPASSGVEGGVPGGVPEGQLGGVLGRILGGSGKETPPPPKPAAHKGPYRVGGNVQARSEERRVGKESRPRFSRATYKKKKSKYITLLLSHISHNLDTRSR